MIKIKDYSINEDVYKGLRFTIFRGIRDYDGKHVIIKIPHVDQFNSSDFSLLKHEYEITKQIDSKFVINILEFNTGETPFLVFEDFGGISLRNFLRKGKLSPRLAIRLAIRLFKGLGDIHNSNIIHKDIKPENIILNFRTSEVRITDFGISTILENENGEIKNPEKLEGSLAYISPEQTGRMNRLLDYRTDYYSMGIVLYEMLTGRLPFGSKDPMELIHSHLAKIPKSPEELQEDIPEILSAIVMKLISKSAEDRYKTSKGIIFDLNECLNQLKILNRIQKFELGSKDISPRFQIPKKLYGRDKQIRLLLDSYDKSSNGTPLFLLVGGYSGMGKSVLVNEIQRPVVEKRGYFISGKYDQFQRDIPYYAIIHAFRDLCRQILTESVSAIQIWKNRILQALEPNTAVITEVIHELEFIVGNVNPVVDLPPVEAQNRFEDSFLNFIKLFATTKSPIALFLDDLQWADLSSLNLLKVLLTELHQGSLLIIGAYRDNEVDIHHPLLNLLGDLKKEKISPIELNLKPLDLENVNALISDTLAQNTGKTKELAELIELKTGGNPFFVGEFISNLYKKSLIKFNRDKAIWEWDIDVLRKQQTTDNVVDLVMGRILELPSSQQEVLKLAACLGSTFSFGELKIVSIKEQKELADLIWNILPMGVLESVGNSGSKLQSFIYQLENENEIKEINNLEFSFLHDRIQQAAYQLISEDDRIRTHYKIGKYLL
ncbi:MAG: AAA family ATPase, partial [Leptospiraceae bacterium]|nr:AAA family ATPase [Leptospiraceae bacterium]